VRSFSYRSPGASHGGGDRLQPLSFWDVVRRNPDDEKGIGTVEPSNGSKTDVQDDEKVKDHPIDYDRSQVL